MGNPGHPKAIFYFSLGLIILLFFSFVFQGSRGIWEPDEGRYTAVALNMLSYDDFLTPRLNKTMPHFSKPPLTYWLIAACVRLFGASEWPVRLPNSLAFFGTCILIYGIGLRLIPKKPWLPVLVYCTSIFPFIAANIVTPDTLLVFWETLAVFGGLSAVTSINAARKRLFFDIMWLGFGLAFLTKGPPSLLPLLAIFIYVSLTEGLPAVKKVFTPEGLLSFLVIGLGWYFMVAIRNKGLFSYLLQYEFIGRVASDVHNRNPKWYMPFVIYLPILLFGSFPWTLIILSKLRRIPSFLRKKYWLDKIRHDKKGLFPVIFLFVPLVIFCLARSRLPFYILPLFVPLSVLIARHLQSSTLFNRRPVQIALLAWIFIMIAAKGVMSVMPYSRDSRALAGAIKQQIRGPLEKIVFIDKSPYYGLTLYLDLEVGRASVYNSDDATCKINKEVPFEEELRAVDSGEEHLLIVPAYNFFDFNGVVKETGYRLKPRGRWRKLHFFELLFK